MTSPEAIQSLLKTVDRILLMEGVNPATVPDDDKIVIAVQYTCLGCAQLTAVPSPDFRESA